MYEPETKRINLGLLQLRGAGDFAASVEIPATGLSVEVKGVGRCRLPLSPEQMVQLRARAQPSPFGYRDETRLDDSVRKSWEIPGSDVHLDATSSIRLQRGIDQTTEALGFPEGVSATMQKLVLYEEGGFFAPHRDTERDPSMWGSLVVVLPSFYQGGKMVIGHAGESRTFDTALDSVARRLCFVGFYADCVHELRPVEAGCRVALIFSLHGQTALRPTPERQLDALRSSLSSFFAGGEEWLVVLLDHSYTRQRFGWSELKNLDRVRVDALRHVGLEDNYSCFLAFADVEEWFGYDDNDSDAEVSRAYFGARDGAQVTLTGWVDEAGHDCVGTDELAEDPCIVSTIPPLDREPYEITGEVWTGNEGGTAAQWYRQAAVVVVPRGGSLYNEVAKRVHDERDKSRTKVVRRRRKVEP